MILTREINPDWVGRKIFEAQFSGGYAAADAHWTHAAIYLGDGLTVCEATFSFSMQGVVQTSLWEYCGDYAIRVRRPHAVATAEEGFLLATKALTQLRKDYDFFYIARLGLQAFAGKGFWSSDVRIRMSPSALVCSTLYADAYTKQTRRVLGEQNSGLCTPAYLSQSGDFDDIPLTWLALE